MDLVMLTPADWIAISNSLEKHIRTNGGEESEAFQNLSADHSLQGLVAGYGSQEVKLSVFETTPRISTYLFTFIAGAYAVEERQARIAGRAEPMRMNFACRASLVP